MMPKQFPDWLSIGTHIMERIFKLLMLWPESKRVSLPASALSTASRVLTTCSRMLRLRGAELFFGSCRCLTARNVI